MSCTQIRFAHRVKFIGHQHLIVVGFLVGAVMAATNSHAQMGVSKNGLVFPDGTEQTTADKDTLATLTCPEGQV